MSGAAGAGRGELCRFMECDYVRRLAAGAWRYRRCMLCARSCPGYAVGWTGAVSSSEGSAKRGSAQRGMPIRLSVQSSRAGCSRWSCVPRPLPACNC